jgi:hypothetical protein
MKYARVQVDLPVGQGDAAHLDTVPMGRHVVAVFDAN